MHALFNSDSQYSNLAMVPSLEGIGCRETLNLFNPVLIERDGQKWSTFKIWNVYLEETIPWAVWLSK